MPPATCNFHFHLHLFFAHLLEERLRSRFVPIGIHPRQARILDALDWMGKASQVELAREFDLSAASMSTMTSRLLTAELVERDVDEQEHRSHVLTLTALGKSLLTQIHREWRQIDREIIELIGEEDADRFAVFSLQLLRAFGGSPPGDDCLERGVGTLLDSRTTS